MSMKAASASGGALAAGSWVPGTRRWVSATLLRALVCLSAVEFCIALGSPAYGQPINENLWVTNGDVYAVVRSGGTIYIGGAFGQVGPATGGGVPLDAATGAPIPAFPKVVGWVSAVLSDRAGGWYIGGRFTSVGGVPRSNLAHVTSDLHVSAWNPGAESVATGVPCAGAGTTPATSTGVGPDSHGAGAPDPRVRRRVAGPGPHVRR